ncbi:MAG TPA: diaminopimelate decarboxylase [Polyangia bacterium]|nr:diaminopimelate decarboxylase [Polyangia bacterium]
MHHFEYRGDDLYCEDVPLARIADEVGTPAYVYSLATLERHFRVFDDALGAGATRKHLICYSMKANSNLAVLRALVSWGAGVDTVSKGEIFRALKAGADPKKIVFSGVGKREDEIAYALEVGILAFNVESHGELLAIERVAARLGKRAPISLRVNPDVDAQTHPYISTGLKKNKFGIPMSSAREEFAFAAKLAHVEIVGLDCHIGSQLTKTSPFRDAIARLGELARALVKDGVRLRYLDIGGGLGISYDQEDPPSPAEYGTAIREALTAFEGLDVTLICEPGRVIVGNAGVLVTRTLYLKHGEIKNFVIVDAAMNDLIRPAFYDSYHGIWPVKKRAGESFVADVVGPICETGDFLARDRSLAQKPVEGELLAVMSAGAYGFTMSSNYNTRPRVAEVMVHGADYAVVRAREELDDLIRGESIPAFLK